MTNRPHFRNALVTLNRADGTKQLVEPLLFYSRQIGLVTVPRGTVTDLASFRIGNLALRGRTEEAAVVHDYLYQTGIFGRSLADDVFAEALTARNVRNPRRWLYWAAVRAFGWKP